VTKPSQSRERTAISWGRTALGAAALGVLLLRVGITRNSPLEFASGVLAVLTSAAFASRGRMAYRLGAVSDTLIAVRATTAALVLVGVLAIIGAIV
jgi:amino acid permease